jgi:hypothetical protein
VENASCGGPGMVVGNRAQVPSALSS